MNAKLVIKIEDGMEMLRRMTESINENMEHRAFMKAYKTVIDRTDTFKAFSRNLGAFIDRVAEDKSINYDATEALNNTYLHTPIIQGVVEYCEHKMDDVLDSESDSDIDCIIRMNDVLLENLDGLQKLVRKAIEIVEGL